MTNQHMPGGADFSTRVDRLGENACFRALEDATRASLACCPYGIADLSDIRTTDSPPPPPPLLAPRVVRQWDRSTGAPTSVHEPGPGRYLGVSNGQPGRREDLRSDPEDVGVSGRVGVGAGRASLDPPPFLRSTCARSCCLSGKGHFPPPPHLPPTPSHTYPECPSSRRPKRKHDDNQPPSRPFTRPYPYTPNRTRPIGTRPAVSRTRPVPAQPYPTVPPQPYRTQPYQAVPPQRVAVSARTQPSASPVPTQPYPPTRTPHQPYPPNRTRQTVTHPPYHPAVPAQPYAPAVPTHQPYPPRPTRNPPYHPAVTHPTVPATRTHTRRYPTQPYPALTVTHPPYHPTVTHANRTHLHPQPYPPSRTTQYPPYRLAVPTHPLPYPPPYAQQRIHHPVPNPYRPPYPPVYHTPPYRTQPYPSSRTHLAVPTQTRPIQPYPPSQYVYRGSGYE
ncbi:hypothetical protein C7M84_017014 [Penaeus vannamei]|uniref:Uncharacterized protein n=1 Tax=Penaeus vannamei TaxID=6689 RepID=A0A3R7QEQ4_PENVA|nr:hypothetical protein C7M84_017014 [Penaeus vannamei]